jgi:hypothetical protein
MSYFIPRLAGLSREAHYADYSASKGGVIALTLAMALELAPAVRPKSFLDRLVIEGADRPIPVDGAYQLRLSGWDASGNPMEPLAVRWESDDSTTAVIDTLGVVRPRREGRVLVRVTAGGWRSDSAWITIVPPEAQTVALEDWHGDVGSRWVLFGTPRPYTRTQGGQTALLPNGDSTDVSGAYLRHRLPASNGVGAEFEISTPITMLQWQEIRLMLLSTDSLDTDSWDLTRGVVLVPNEQWRECFVHYPFGENEAGPSKIQLGWGLYRTFPAPASLRTGQWARIRIQLFPDGRCGLAVNGRALGILQRRAPPGDSTMVLLWGRSFHTDIEVGSVEVWTGVRRDVDWDALKHRAVRADSGLATGRSTLTSCAIQHRQLAGHNMLCNNELRRSSWLTS